MTHVVFYAMFVYMSLISTTSPIAFSSASTTALPKHLPSPCHVCSLELQNIVRATGLTQAADRCHA
jgi:hypothetical protein